MENSQPSEPTRDDRREMIKRWAAYVRSHPDEEWSRQQNRVIDPQLESANELVRAGATDSVRFMQARDRLRDRENPD